MHQVMPRCDPHNLEITPAVVLLLLLGHEALDHGKDNVRDQQKEHEGQQGAEEGEGHHGHEAEAKGGEAKATEAEGAVRGSNHDVGLVDDGAAIKKQIVGKGGQGKEHTQRCHKAH